mgnify:CR=1 FL=1
MTNSGDVLHMMYREYGLNAISLETFKENFTGKIGDISDAELLDSLASDENVAINLDGSISGVHRATSGNVSARIEQLHNAIASSPSPAVTENFKNQLALIEKKRKTIAITDVQLKLTDNWIPKDILLTFLHDSGYSKFKLGKYVTGENDIEYFDDTYRGADAVFTGYRINEQGNKSSKPEEAFERQIESYLNAGAVRGGGSNAGKAAVRKQISLLDSQLTQWGNSGDFAEQLESTYNNTFNNYIEPDYDDSKLNLTGVSGAIEFMGYQNAAIRRHAADGCGILGFGTGLGKTLTGGYLTLAATLCTAEIAQTISEGEASCFMHGPTYMANPLACAVANASIDLLINQDWQGKINTIEQQFQQELLPLKQFDKVASTRVLGSIGVVETTQAVNVATIQKRFVELGVWIRPFGKLIYIMPPLVINKSQISQLVGAIKTVLTEETCFLD